MARLLRSRGGCMDFVERLGSPASGGSKRRTTWDPRPPKPGDGCGFEGLPMLSDASILGFSEPREPKRRRPIAHDGLGRPSKPIPSPGLAGRGSRTVVSNRPADAGEAFAAGATRTKGPSESRIERYSSPQLYVPRSPFFRARTGAAGSRSLIGVRNSDAVLGEQLDELRRVANRVEGGIGA